MALSPDLDQDRLCEAALAILSLTAFPECNATRAWKGMDWDVLDALHQRGWIHDPRNKAKSLAFTSSGAKLAAEFLKRHFGREKPFPVT